MALIRLSKIHKFCPEFPFTIKTIYRFHHEGKYPGMICKLGGSLMIDTEKIKDFVTVRDIPTLKEKRDA